MLQYVTAFGSGSALLLECIQPFVFMGQGYYIYMLAFAIFLELAGGLLLIFNSTLGALLLVGHWMPCN